jgi:hypothetical protein
MALPELLGDALKGVARAYAAGDPSHELLHMPLGSLSHLDFRFTPAARQKTHDLDPRG